MAARIPGLTARLLVGTLSPVRPTVLETPAWLMSGVATVNAKRGTLRLEHDRLSFRETGASAPTFDLAVADLRDVTFPVYNVGTVVRFDSGGERYRLAFLRSWLPSGGSSGRAHGFATFARRAAGADSGEPRWRRPMSPPDDAAHRATGMGRDHRGRAPWSSNGAQGRAASRGGRAERASSALSS